MLLAANRDGVFGRLREVIGRVDLAGDPRFADHQARGQATEELAALVTDWAGPQLSQDLLDALHAAALLASAVVDIDEQDGPGRTVDLVMDAVVAQRRTDPAARRRQALA